MYSSFTAPHSRLVSPVIHRCGGVIHKLIHNSNDKKRKETKTIERRIIAVYYSTKRLNIVIVSLLII